VSAATQRGVDLGLNDDPPSRCFGATSEVAFYEALAANDGAVEAMGTDELKVIAAELVTQVRKSVTIAAVPAVLRHLPGDSGDTVSRIHRNAAGRDLAVADRQI